jgi:hypothetical protein
LQRRQGVGHLVHQRFGQAEVPTAARRGIAPGQRHFAGHRTTLLGGGHPGRRLGGPTLRIQCRCRAGLTCRSGRLHPLQPGDLLDQRGLVGVRIDRRQLRYIEHVFDYTRLHRRNPFGRVARHG